MIGDIFEKYNKIQGTLKPDTNCDPTEICLNYICLAYLPNGFKILRALMTFALLILIHLCFCFTLEFFVLHVIIFSKIREIKQISRMKQIGNPPEVNSRKPQLSLY